MKKIAYILLAVALPLMTACDKDDSNLEDLIAQNEELIPETGIVYVTFGDGTATVTNNAKSMVTVVRNANGHVALNSSATDTEINVVVSGSGTNNSLYVEGSYRMTLTLDGVNITNPDSAAIRIRNGKRINVVVNNTNVLTDNATNAYYDAALWIKGHAEFSGAGTLTVTGRNKHAVKCNEYCIMTPTFTGTLNIAGAVSDGIQCGEYFLMENGQVNIDNVGGDGLQVDSAEVDDVPTLPGYMKVNGGKITVKAASEDVKGIKMDGNYEQTAGDVTVTVTGENSKGLKCGGAGVISGGTFTGYNSGNGSKSISSDSNFTLQGGSITIEATGAKSDTYESNCFGIKLDGTWNHTAGSVNITTGASTKAAIKDANLSYGSKGSTYAVTK